MTSILKRYSLLEQGMYIKKFTPATNLIKK